MLKGGFLEGDIRRLQERAFGGPRGDWSLEDRFHHGGYARTTPGLDAFAADFEHRHGLPVERVYVAKMLYALLTLTEEGAFPRGTTLAAVVTGRPFPERVGTAAPTRPRAPAPAHVASRYAAASSRSSRRSRVRSISSSM